MPAAIPVTIIGGYLGSGKTTLVNHLLRNANGIRMAVLVNDFGELPIDADLIAAQEGDVISLSGGCVCCSYGDDLSLSLRQLLDQTSPPEHIFIEASGVALPGAIGQSLSLIRAYQLEGIVVLADATSVMLSSEQKYIGDTIQRQLRDADLILLNKTDLLSEIEVIGIKQWVTHNYSQAPVVLTAFGKVDPTVLLEIKGDCNAYHSSTDWDYSHDVSSVFSSFKLKMNRSVDADVLAEKLADIRCGLVRAKGFVLDHDGTLKTIQVVGRRWSVTDAPTGVETGLVCIACSSEISSELSKETVLSFCNLNC
jgi:G3E family GTPase